MDNHISIYINLQEHTIGSQEYKLNVKITNISGFSLENLEIFNEISFGVNTHKNEIIDSNINDLENKKRKLILELEECIKTAYSRKRYKELSTSQKILLFLLEIFDVYSAFFYFSKNKRNNINIIPEWAEQALCIYEWQDVEKLETEIISFEPEDSFLRKTYKINKEKLKRILSQLDVEKSKQFSRGVSLPPNSTISFPFSFKAPHLLKQKKVIISFKCSYQVEDQSIIHTQTIEKDILAYPSAFAVPTGGIVGAILGYIIKSTSSSTPSNDFINWQLLLGSITLGLVLSLLTSRKPELSGGISAEDFVGGIIVGAMAGIYSETILNKLSQLIQ